MDPMLHSFGGSALDRHLFDFDTDDGIGDGGIIPAADVTPDPPVDVTPPWTPSQDEWNQIAGAVGYLAQLEQQRASVYQPAPDNQGARFDPYSDDPDSLLRQVIREETAPLAYVAEQRRLEEGSQRAMDILADVESREGEFDKQLARIRATDLLPAMQERYGAGPQAAQAALEQAAKDQRAYEQQLFEAAVQKHTNQLKTLSGAPGDAGATYTVGAQTRTVPDFRNGGSVTDRFFQNA